MNTQISRNLYIYFLCFLTSSPYLVAEENSSQAVPLTMQEETKDHKVKREEKQEGKSSLMNPLLLGSAVVLGGGVQYAVSGGDSHENELLPLDDPRSRAPQVSLEPPAEDELDLPDNQDHMAIRISPHMHRQEKDESEAENQNQNFLHPKKSLSKISDASKASFSSSISKKSTASRAEGIQTGSLLNTNTIPFQQMAIPSAPYASSHASLDKQGSSFLLSPLIDDVQSSSYGDNETDSQEPHEKSQKKKKWWKINKNKKKQDKQENVGAEDSPMVTNLKDMKEEVTNDLNKTQKSKPGFINKGKEKYHEWRKRKEAEKERKEKLKEASQVENEINIEHSV